MIEVRDVWKRFRGEHSDVLAGVNLDVSAGELVVLTGPSGSGKSTLLNVTAALDRVDRGSIRVGSRDVTRRRGLNEFRRNEIGIVFQLHNLLPRLSAAANIEIVMLATHRSLRERRRRAEELLAAVDLADRASDTPPTLSGGERQRVAIARSLANSPSVLLADEPTGSLDDETADCVINLMRELASRGGAVLAVSHDPRLTNAANRVVALEDGRIHERSGVATARSV